MNILNAAMLAMKRAYEGLDVKPDTALIDGNKTPGLDIPETAGLSRACGLHPGGECGTLRTLHEKEWSACG